MIIARPVTFTKGNGDIKTRAMLMVEEKDRLQEMGRLELVQRYEPFGDECKRM